MCADQPTETQDAEPANAGHEPDLGPTRTGARTASDGYLYRAAPGRFDVQGLPAIGESNKINIESHEDP